MQREIHVALATHPTVCFGHVLTGYLSHTRWLHKHITSIMHCDVRLDVYLFIYQSADVWFLQGSLLAIGSLVMV